MAFTRNFLKTMSLTDEQVQAIMEEHTNVTEALKGKIKAAEDQAAAFKADADKLPDIQKQLDDLKNGEDWKSKYEKEHEDFDSYKKKIVQEQETEKIKAAYSKLLTDEHINEKHIGKVLKLTDFSEMKLDKDGNLENADDLKKAINDEWGEFKVNVSQRKQTVPTPPAGNNGSGGGSGMSRGAELAKRFNRERYGIKDDAGKE